MTVPYITRCYNHLPATKEVLECVPLAVLVFTIYTYHTQISTGLANGWAALYSNTALTIYKYSAITLTVVAIIDYVGSRLSLQMAKQVRSREHNS